MPKKKRTSSKNSLPSSEDSYGDSDGERQNIKNKAKRKKIGSFVDFTTTEEFLNGLSEAVYFSRLPFDKLSMDEIRDLDISYALEFNEEYLAVRNTILYIWRRNITEWIDCDKLLELLPKLNFFKNIKPDSSQFTKMIINTYQFLNRNGYINYGFLTKSKYPNGIITSLKLNHYKILEKLPVNEHKDRKHIVVIGAGFAGIFAAKQLISFGYRVTLIEARNRPGGRVLTDFSWTDDAPVDIGASIVTCSAASPVVGVAEQTQIKLKNIGKEDQLFQSNGQILPKDLDDKYQRAFNDILDRVCSLKQPIFEREREDYRRDIYKGFTDSHPKDMTGDSRVSKTDMSLGFALDKMTEKIVNEAPEEERKTMREVLQWHTANLDYGVGHDIESASLYFWDQDDIYELGGEHLFVKKGFSSMIDALCNDAQDLDKYIEYNQMVVDVDYSNPDIVRVKTKKTPETTGIHRNPIGKSKQLKEVKIDNNGDDFEYDCDAVLTTVPLGVLQGKSQLNTCTFNPPLPEWKTNSINKLGFGLLNKIILEFDYVFWQQDHFYFGLTHEDPSERGFCYLFWNLYPLTKKPLLCGLVTGNAAYAIEENDTNLEYIKSKVMKYLRKSFAWSTNLPDPKKIMRTNWYHDPFSTGSYSYVRMGAKGEEYDLLAETINNRVYFGGEHTCRKFPATVMGAVISGLREAAKIDKYFSGLLFKKPKNIEQQEKPVEQVEKPQVDPSQPSKLGEILKPVPPNQRGWRRHLNAAILNDPAQFPFPTQDITPHKPQIHPIPGFFQYPLLAFNPLTPTLTNIPYNFVPSPFQFRVCQQPITKTQEKPTEK